jgi:hypothetical protein
MGRLIVIPLLVCLVTVATACQESLGPLDPVVDQDPYSQLARLLRQRNQSIDLGGAQLSAHIEQLSAQTEDPGLLEALSTLDSQLEENPEGPVNQVFATRVLQRAFADTRDTLYILYGNLSDQEIEFERTDWNHTIERMLPWRGYRVQIDRDTGFEEWQETVMRRDAAGIIWRSHGNLEQHPYRSDLNHFMARVLTQGGSRDKIFAADWQAILPEGLSLLVLATCMSDGLYLPDDFDLVEDRGNARLENATIATFETEIGDRALHYKGYRGPSFSPGIGPVAWFTLKHFLPQRLYLPQDFPENAAEGVDLGVVPLEWLPHFMELLEAADGRVFEALGKLSERLGQPLASNSPTEWQAWWESQLVIDAFATHQRLVDTRPPWDLVWAHLWSAFEKERNTRGGIPKGGPDCWRAWFHCILDREQLPERLVEQDGQATWQMILPPDTQSTYPCPLPEELVVQYNPDTRQLTHNLHEIMDTIDHDQISCLSIY